MTYSITIADTPELIEAIRPQWEALQWHPNADIDFFLMVCEQEDSIISPYVLCIHEESQQRAIVVARIENRTIPIRFGYKSIFSRTFRSLTIVRGGLLGDLTNAECIYLVNYVMGMLRRRDIDVIFFSGLPCDSPVYREAKMRPPVQCRDYAHRPASLWLANIPNNANEFFTRIQKKNMKKLQRYWKFLHADNDNSVSFRSFSDSNEVNKLCEDAELIAKTTYHRGIGVGFIDTEAMRRRLFLYASKDTLRGFVLYVKECPVAFWIGILYKKIFYSQHTGYNPIFSKYDCGTFTFKKVIEAICGPGGAELLDFGEGDALYKQRFGDHTIAETNILVFAPKATTVGFNIVRTMAFLAKSALVWTFDRGSLIQRVKKRWRDLVKPRIS